MQLRCSLLHNYAEIWNVHHATDIPWKGRKLICIHASLQSTVYRCVVYKLFIHITFPKLFQSLHELAVQVPIHTSKLLFSLDCISSLKPLASPPSVSCLWPRCLKNTILRERSHGRLTIELSRHSHPYNSWQSHCQSDTPLSDTFSLHSRAGYASAWRASHAFTKALLETDSALSPVSLHGLQTWFSSYGFSIRERSLNST